MSIPSIFSFHAQVFHISIFTKNQNIICHFKIFFIYRKATDFCIVLLLPDLILSSLIWYKEFPADFLMFFHYAISFANNDNIILFFPIFNATFMSSSQLQWKIIIFFSRTQALKEYIYQCICQSSNFFLNVQSIDFHSTCLQGKYLRLYISLNTLFVVAHKFHYVIFTCHYFYIP